MYFLCMSLIFLSFIYICYIYLHLFYSLFIYICSICIHVLFFRLPIYLSVCLSIFMFYFLLFNLRHIFVKFYMIINIFVRMCIFCLLPLNISLPFIAFNLVSFQHMCRSFFLSILHIYLLFHILTFSRFFQCRSLHIRFAQSIPFLSLSLVGRLSNHFFYLFFSVTDAWIDIK